MPIIYLSPSTQEDSKFIIGGSEEYYMNLLTDAMVPYLRASKIDFSRNSPGNTLAQIIAQSNSGNYDLHIALHSNASPETMKGVLQGPDVYYYTTSMKGKKAADIIEGNLEKIYEAPSLVMVIPTTTLAELRRTKAPAVLIEIAYQDNYSDAAWLRDNIDLIAKNLVQSLTGYFEIPFESQSPAQNPSTDKITKQKRIGESKRRKKPCQESI